MPKPNSQPRPQAWRAEGAYSVTREAMASIRLSSASMLSMLLILLSFKLTASLVSGMGRQMDVSFLAMGKLLLTLFPLVLIGSALITALAGMHGIAEGNERGNSRSGSIYIVKPKQHGPAEVALIIPDDQILYTTLTVAPQAMPSVEPGSSI